ncbi:protein FAR1-RELATED SEQUENCE 5-like [Arachis ipaensis]|uniref:protein FAR1-RELATED SEQUENCE 5-like n=1 Tax=Arachis ipaensis TaxID=130454 RepID=UPI0007AFAB01|nr:protein FAR1-RELATED SEQUENCE 5-like [Arachis ipaensis]
MATLIQDNWFVIKQEKDIGSTLKGTIGKGSIGQLLVSIARLGFVSFVTIGRGGYDKVGFTSKDLHNHISKTRRGQVKDDDAFAALAYLLSKADNDPLFLGKFTLKDGKLDNLVWVDRAIVVDCECFGDVLAFDTTYKKNVYNKPLVIFSGTNHHGQTTIFGCALLSDERSKTFKWALKKFLEIMSDKLFGGVMTNRDPL